MNMLQIKWRKCDNGNFVTTDHMTSSITDKLETSNMGDCFATDHMTF